MARLLHHQISNCNEWWGWGGFWEEGQEPFCLPISINRQKKPSQYRKRKSGCSGWGTFKWKYGQMAHLLQVWTQCLLTPYQNGALKIPLWMSIVERGSSLYTLIVRAWSNANKKGNTTKLQPVNKVIVLSTFGKNEVPSIGHNVKIIWLKLERVISRVVLRTPLMNPCFSFKANDYYI